MTTADYASLPGRARRELKARAKTRPVDLRVGRKGVTGNLLAELRKVFESGDLAKVAFSHSERPERLALVAELEDKLAASTVATAGKTATLYKPRAK